jgi:hypothetical protein
MLKNGVKQTACFGLFISDRRVQLVRIHKGNFCQPAVRKDVFVSCVHSLLTNPLDLGNVCVYGTWFIYEIMVTD